MKTTRQRHGRRQRLWLDKVGHDLLDGGDTRAVLAISQAICEHRRDRGIDGPPCWSASTPTHCPGRHSSARSRFLPQTASTC
jgi:hypothetical protein